MENRPPLPAYMAGDTIRVGPIGFRHEMNVEYVTATFLHEDGDHQIVLSGNPERTGPPQQIATASGPRLIHYGSVQLEGLIVGTDPPGEYRCVGLTAHTSGGNEVAFEDKPNLRFVVVREPSRGPVISGTVSLGLQEFHYHAGAYDQDKDEWIRPQYDYEQGKFIDPE